MQIAPSSPNNYSINMLPPPPPQPQPPPTSVPFPTPTLKLGINKRKLLKQLRKRRNVLETDYKRWHRRNHEVTMILLSFLSIYSTVLLGVVIIQIKFSFDCMYSTMQTLMGFIGLFYTLNYEKKLKFTNTRLLENWKKKNELKDTWEDLKDHGVAEEEMDAWFVDEDPPSYYHIIAPLAAYLFPIVAVLSLFYFMLQCWIRCGMKSFSCGH